MPKYRLHANLRRVSCLIKQFIEGRLTMRQKTLVLLIALAVTACNQPAKQAKDNPKAAGDESSQKNAKGGAEISMLTGVWQRSGGALTPSKLTEYGKSVSAGTGVFDDPTTRCEGFSIPRSTISEFGVTKITVGKDAITISYEGEGDRRIPLDGKTPGSRQRSQANLLPESIEARSRSKAGTSGPKGRI